MRIIWLCNICAPIISESLKTEKEVVGGWIQSALNPFMDNSDYEILYFFPNDNFVKGRVKNITFVGFKRDDVSINTKNLFESEINRFKPEVIHVWGTEYRYCFDMLQVCNNIKILDKMVVNIQGLIYKNAEKYTLGLPKAILKKQTIRDFIKHENILVQKNNFYKRGENEKKFLRLVKHVIGRTDWDKNGCLSINPNLQYYFCNETLRDGFYKNNWDISKTERLSIFSSQGNYPIKGMHFLIPALAIVKKEFPNIKLYVAGENILKNNFLESQRGTYYSFYIRKLIKKYNLENNVMFLGKLDEDSMIKMYLKSNLFISPSILENSSNSVCEAMCLGVPVVSSYVGGIPTLINNGETGLLYEVDNIEEIAKNILKILKNDDLAKKLSSHEIKVARVRHDKIGNFNTLLKIYNKIMEK